jgi:hypothetical protein
MLYTCDVIQEVHKRPACTTINCRSKGVEKKWRMIYFVDFDLNVCINCLCARSVISVSLTNAFKLAYQTRQYCSFFAATMASARKARIDRLFGVSGDALPVRVVAVGCERGRWCERSYDALFF